MCVRVCVCVGACACVCVCACAWAPADGMTHLDCAVLYSGMWACHIRVRSGWGSTRARGRVIYVCGVSRSADGKVHNVVHGLRDVWKPSGAYECSSQLHHAPKQFLKPRNTLYTLPSGPQPERKTYITCPRARVEHGPT